jgi:hypothetical protein
MTDKPQAKGYNHGMSEQAATSRNVLRKIVALAVMLIALWCLPAAVCLWVISGLSEYIVISLCMLTAVAVFPLAAVADRLWKHSG